MEISAVISKEEFEALKPRIDWTGLSNRRILVTGATGMVGSWLTTALLFGLDQGILVNSKIDALVHSGNITNLRTFRNHKSLGFVRIKDIEERSDLDYDLIIHAASPASPQFFRNLDSMIEINLGFLQAVLAKSKEPPEVIYFSTGEVYGAGFNFPVRETDEGVIDLSQDRSMYPLTKRNTEKLIIKMSVNLGLRFSIFRLFHTFGSGMRIGDGRSFADFIWDGALRKRPRLYSTGSQVRSFLYLEDMVAAVLGTERNNEIMNLGSPHPVTIREFAQIVSEESGLNGEIDFPEEDRGFDSSPNNFLVPDTTKIQMTGWNQQISLREGISRSIAWARK
jgi:UDP-glucuronate decarboxylase